MKLTKPKEKIFNWDVMSWPITQQDQETARYIVFKHDKRKILIFGYMSSAMQFLSKKDLLVIPSKPYKYATWDDNEVTRRKWHPMCNLPDEVRAWRLLHGL